VSEGIVLAKGLLQQATLPLFGICLGHQILGLALGGSSFKLGYPQLPTLLSLLDAALDREHDFGRDWPTARLRQVRRQAEYAVFKSIAYCMRKNSSWENRCHENMLHHISQQTGAFPKLISFNYDLRIDYAVIEVDGGGLPDYGCDIQTEGYDDAPKAAELFKLHGSMHWMCCPTCHRLELGVDKQGKLRKTGLRAAESLASLDFVEGFSKDGLDCPECQSEYRPVMITPTSLKDYRNPHITGLWYRAERALRKADRVVFVGYSLPWDDIDVIYLLKRGIGDLPGKSITVVEWSKEPCPMAEHEAGRRYQAMFGRDLDWQPVGFEQWSQSLGIRQAPRKKPRRK
jgi:hypothetical protein